MKYKFDLPEKFQKLLDDCTPEVRDYMESVMFGLISDYGTIDDSYYASLRLIRDNYQMYVMAYADIQANGLKSRDSQSHQHRNPSLQLLFQAQKQLQQLLGSFCFTPMTKSKMKAISKGTDKQSPLEAFMLAN